MYSLYLILSLKNAYPGILVISREINTLRNDARHLISNFSRFIQKSPIFTFDFFS